MAAPSFLTRRMKICGILFLCIFVPFNGKVGRKETIKPLAVKKAISFSFFFPSSLPPYAMKLFFPLNCCLLWQQLKWALLFFSLLLLTGGPRWLHQLVKPVAGSVLSMVAAARVQLFPNACMKWLPQSQTLELSTRP